MIIRLVLAFMLSFVALTPMSAAGLPLVDEPFTKAPAFKCRDPITVLEISADTLGMALQVKSSEVASKLATILWQAADRAPPQVDTLILGFKPSQGSKVWVYTVLNDCVRKLLVFDMSTVLIGFAQAVHPKK